MKEIITKYPHLLHGGDYNPEQWIDCPKVLEEDIRLMKEAHVNCVSLGIFSWAKLEPEEGEFHFGWLRRIIDHLFENGIYTILATPTGAMPHWMTAKYEEVRQMGPDGVRNLPGRRHNFCYTSPVMRKKMKKINHELSRHLGNHPGVILWHISNEYGGNGSDASCHCPHCQQAFREWLKEKYKTLDNLNHAWWTTFWSHTYTDWSQIHSPVPNGENGLHGLNLDWKRFVSHQIQDFCKEEIHAVLKYSVLEIKYWVRTVIDSVSMLITGQYSVNDLSGPVGVVDAIGTAYDDVKSQGVLVTVMTMLNMVILLSSNLGVMNLLPFPALDGGRLVFLAYELAAKKPVDQRIEGAVNMAGMALLMAFMVFVLLNDVRFLM